MTSTNICRLSQVAVEYAEAQRNCLNRDIWHSPPPFRSNDWFNSGMEGAFVGRTAESKLLDEGLVAAREGRGGLLLVTGEPGIGKSRLTAEFTDRARMGGARVVWGRCWEAGG